MSKTLKMICKSTVDSKTMNFCFALNYEKQHNKYLKFFMALTLLMKLYNNLYAETTCSISCVG